MIFKKNSLQSNYCYCCNKIFIWQGRLFLLTFKLKSMINRYTLITLLLQEHQLDESFRSFLSNQTDTVLLSNNGYKCIRPGFYTLI